MINEQSPPEIKIQHTRRYLLYLIGGFLFPNTTGLYVHNSWLYLLRDFNETRKYSWGSAVLAYLYRGLCEASHPNIKALAKIALILDISSNLVFISYLLYLVCFLFYKYYDYYYNYFFINV